MINRFVIGLLVVLVILTGGIGFYLNQQVNNLGERLAAYESEQTAHISSITDNLAALKTNTESGLSLLESKVKSTQTDITAMKSDLSAAKDRITGAEQIVSQVSSNVTTLDKVALVVLTGVLVTLGVYPMIMVPWVQSGVTYIMHLLGGA